MIQSKEYYKKKIIYLTYILFMLPPMIWLVGSLYAGIWNFAEMIKLMASFQMVGFVVFFLTIITLYLKSSMSAVEPYQKDPTKDNLANAQKAMASYPKGIFFISLIYCIVGPTVVVYGRDFITQTEWILAEMMGVPLIILFSVPFLIELIYAIDEWGIDLPLPKDNSGWKLRSRTSIASFSTLFGSIVLVMVNGFAIINSMQCNNESVSLSIMFYKLLLPVAIILLIGFLNTIIMGSKSANALNYIIGVIEDKINHKSENKSINIVTRDEIGELAQQFNTFFDISGDVVEKTIKNSSNTQNASEQLKKTALEQTEKSKEISSKSKHITNFTVSIETSVNTIETNSESITESIKSIHSLSTDINTALLDINADCKTETEMTQDATKQAQENIESMAMLKNAANEISKVLGLVHDIADQTNLLALNATIEAASAGDAGKGFAVVASEVKELAKQTASAIDSIDDKIEQIQNHTDSSSTKIKSITDIIRKIDDISIKILTKTQAQLESTQIISENTSSTEVISLDNNKSIHKVAEDINNISDSIKSVDDNITNMVDGITEISNISEKLKDLTIEQKSIVSELRI